MFDIFDMGLISLYFGLKFERNYTKKTLKVFQLAYISKTLTKYYLDQTKLHNVLMKEDILLYNERLKISQTKQKKYPGIIKSLIFSIVRNRPNIIFTIFIISQFAENFFCQYKETIKTIIKYLKAMKLVGIVYKRK